MKLLRLWFKEPFNIHCIYCDKSQTQEKIPGLLWQADSDVACGASWHPKWVPEESWCSISIQLPDNAPRKPVEMVQVLRPLHLHERPGRIFCFLDLEGSAPAITAIYLGGEVVDGRLEDCVCVCVASSLSLSNN